jgi:hypothetical protein
MSVFCVDAVGMAGSVLWVQKCHFCIQVRFQSDVFGAIFASGLDCGHERLDSDDLEHAFDVVGQHV